MTTDTMDADAFSALIAEIALAVHRSLFTTQPVWCNFAGVTCSSMRGSPSYASVLDISLGGLALSGTLPDLIGNFQSMTYLDFQWNFLAGTIPATIPGLTSLQHLILLFNRMTGPLPPYIGGLTH